MHGEKIKINSSEIKISVHKNTNSTFESGFPTVTSAKVIIMYTFVS
jgi:hypothetical protein